MTRRAAGCAAALAALALAVGGAGCSKPTTSGESSAARPAEPSPAQNGDDRMNPEQPSPNAARPGRAVTIYGIPLGAPYADAIAAAPASLSLEPDGADYHRGTGTLDGVQARAELEGAAGRLVDISIELVLAEPDAGLAQSKPYAALVRALGEPASASADVARWAPAGPAGPAGYEVTLQRSELFDKGDDEPRVEYALRARALPGDAADSSGSPDPAAAEAKRREDEAAGER